MGSLSFLGFLFGVLVMGSLSSSHAHKFLVGGKDGWGSNPSENYNHWAGRNRFQVNDTLLFKYKKGSDSVLVVTKDQYNSCNTTSPKQSLTDGESVFKFDRSGPFYFISGTGDHCKKGQKLIIIVLAVRNKTRHAPPPSTAPVPKPPVSPSPTAETPASPPTTQPPVAKSPKGESPQPAAVSPSDMEPPAPAPAKSSAPGFTGSVGLALGISIGVSVVLGSFVGMV
ncbi:early nodulin-like protein 1 [Quercus robur]|uniref:early nodulin-like protein 1 n=1 Tax=Quercus robur TaxID=38942 RepID=UPI002163F491|nr:early nodulin-like protein 1 [Quercus robur]